MKARKIIKRLRVGLSHLRYYKCKFNFQNTLNLLYNYGLNTAFISHYPLHCPLFEGERKAFLSDIKSFNHRLLAQNNLTLTQTLLPGDPASGVETNTLIFNVTI